MKFIDSFASVRGSEHIRNNIPNQDACFSKYDGNIIVLTVADGLGSREKSHHGSAIIGETVYYSFKKWIENGSIYLNKLISLIIQNWESKFNNTNEYATTCLFTVIYKNKIYVGQIGDGILSYIINDSVHILIKPNKEFANVTNSIANSLVNDWVVRSIDLNANDKIAILMATDGIADTLLTDKIGSFVNYMITNINKDIEYRNNFLEKLASEWESIDDKTISLIYN